MNRSMTDFANLRLRSLLTAVALLVFVALPAVAQDALPGTQVAQQSLRPYVHVFLAYAVAIVLVLGWVISISKRLKDVEARLEE